MNHPKVSDIANIYSGIKVYEVGKGKPPQTEKIRDEKPFTSALKKGENWYPFFDGKHIGRYELLWENNNWLNYGPFLAAPREPANFDGEKILIRKITSKKLIATYVKETSYCNTLLFVLKLKNSVYSYRSVLAILNSTLIGWYFRKKFQISDEDTFPQIMIRDILQFPIPKITKETDVQLSGLVDKILEMKERLKDTKLESQRTQITQIIDHCENKIDQLVCAIYNLNHNDLENIE